jgi:TPR repeat protein
LEKGSSIGDMDAHYNLSLMYRKGNGVEKDKKKEIYHLEESAIGGHYAARYSLGAYDAIGGRYDRAMKHHIIAANLGYDRALEEVKEGFRKGHVSKEDFEAALRGHQAAVDATKSKQREEAYVFDNLSTEEKVRWLQSKGHREALLLG